MDSQIRPWMRVIGITLIVDIVLFGLALLVMRLAGWNSPGAISNLFFTIGAFGQLVVRIPGLDPLFENARVRRSIGNPSEAAGQMSARTARYGM